MSSVNTGSPLPSPHRTRIISASAVGTHDRCAPVGFHRLFEWKMERTVQQFAHSGHIPLAWEGYLWPTVVGANILVLVSGILPQNRNVFHSRIVKVINYTILYWPRLRLLKYRNLSSGSLNYTILPCVLRAQHVIVYVMVHANVLNRLSRTSLKDRQDYKEWNLISTINWISCISLRKMDGLNVEIYLPSILHN